MFTIEDDRRTSASDPAPRTTSINELTLSKRDVPAVSPHQSDGSPLPLPRNGNPANRQPNVHFTPETQSPPPHRTTGPNVEPLSQAQAELEQAPKLEQSLAIQMAIIEKWMGARPKIATLRAHILTLRLSVKRERERYGQLEELIESVMDSFIRVLNTAASSGSYLSSRDEMEHLQRKIQSCRDDLKRQRDKCVDMDDSLCNQEYKLTELEGAVYRELDLDFRTGQPTHSNTGTAITPPTTVISDANTAASIQGELYSRMGDLRVLLDRLNDFEFELRQELDERDVLRATGQVELSSDEAFIEERKKERTDLQEEVEQVQIEVDNLKEICRDMGVDFEDVQFPLPSYEAHISETSTATSGHHGLLHPPEPPASQRSGSSSVINTFLNSRDRVNRWLRDPAKPDGLQNPIVEENESVQHQQELPLATALSSAVGTSSVPSSQTIRNIRDALPGMPSWTIGRHLQRRASEEVLQLSRLDSIPR